MNLAPAPWRITGAPNYRNIVDADGVPVYAVAARDALHGGVEASEAHATLAAATRDLLDALIRLHTRAEHLLSEVCHCTEGSDDDSEINPHTGEVECEVCATLRIAQEAIAKAAGATRPAEVPPVEAQADDSVKPAPRPVKVKKPKTETPQ